MSAAPAKTRAAARDRSRSYRAYSLVTLVGRIVRRADARAVRELHDHRTVLQYDGRWLRFAEYLGQLRESALARKWCHGDATVLDQAYDLTLDKFCRLPSRSSRCGCPGLKRDGPDCRYYFKAFLEHLGKKIEFRRAKGELERELMAAQALQAHVLRHFYLSCLECIRRAHRLVRGHLRQLDGQALWLWFPAEMIDSRCGEWLGANATTREGVAPAEQDSLQALIDDEVSAHWLGLCRHSGCRSGLHSEHGHELPWAVTHGLSAGGLAEAVAQEKADDLAAQRPAIRALGADKLAQLVRDVFAGLSEGVYDDGHTAKRFGLTKATFSRFAGSRWARKDPSAGPVPDLWRNTAHVLASNLVFVQAARAAGIWKRIEAVLEVGGSVSP